MTIDLKTVQLILFIIIVHWFADFVMQTDEEAKGKSYDNKKLLSHTATYSFIWLWTSLWLSLILDLPKSFIWFAPITFVCHTITDYYTSRINKKLWMKNNYHGFFISVGFDQVLHYVQLFLTYWYLTK
jgi:hypothetical protein